jgi:hypothetical protein
LQIFAVSSYFNSLVSSLRGLWAGLNNHITEEDIAEARREMWGNFPRDIY